MRCIHAVLLAATLAAPLVAQPQADLREPRHLRLAEIIGIQVRSAGGEALGVIRDLLLDETSGKIAYIAVDGPRGLRRYPVDDLVAGAPGEVVVESNASGGSSLAGSLQPEKLTAASGRSGDGEPVVDLLDGRLGFAPQQ